MALRILPYRDYDEHEVVNLYALAGVVGRDFVNLDPAGSLQSNVGGDAGVFVKVLNGSMGPAGKDPIDVTSDTFGSYLGKKDYPHVGRNTYPANALTVTGVSASGDACLGITLRQTATHDENGEKLQYNPVKKDELYAVLPGETVPVLSRGMVTLTDAAIHGDPAIGATLVPREGGMAEACGTDRTSLNSVGVVLASGSRDDAARFSHTGNNSFKGKNSYGNFGFQSGKYYVVKLNCS